jgi:hypothetical protein
VVLIDLYASLKNVASDKNRAWSRPISAFFDDSKETVAFDKLSSRSDNSDSEQSGSQ